MPFSQTQWSKLSGEHQITRKEISKALKTTIKTSNLYTGDLTSFTYDRDKKTAKKNPSFR